MNLMTVRDVIDLTEKLEAALSDVGLTFDQLLSLKKEAEFLERELEMADFVELHSNASEKLKQLEAGLAEKEEIDDEDITDINANTADDSSAGGSTEPGETEEEAATSEDAEYFTPNVT